MQTRTIGQSLSMLSLAIGTAQAAEFIDAPDDSRLAAPTFRSALEIVLNDGHALEWIEVRDARGVPLGYVVEETRTTGQPGVADDPALARLDPAELLWAVAPDGANMPSELAAAYPGSEPSRPVGWARDSLTWHPPQTYYDACAEDGQTFAEFSADVHSFGYGHTFLSQDDGPLTQPLHWYDHPGEPDPKYFMLTGSAHDVGAFFATVRTCMTEGEGHTRWWGYDYRTNAGWNNIDGDHLDSPGATVAFWWHPIENPWGLTAESEICFRIRIGHVQASDRFWIGATWSTPDDKLMLTAL